MITSAPGFAERKAFLWVTTSPFAALDIATGHVIGKCYPRYRAAEFRKFLDEIEANVLGRSRRYPRH
jgi:hypothetical protein